MGMVIGIDVGGSTTKIIGVDGEGIKHPMIVSDRPHHLSIWSFRKIYI